MISLTWQPPCAGFVKCNCDASCDPITGEASAVLIICNDVGHILEGDTRLFKACYANAAKVVAIRLGFFLTVRADFSFVIFESDCANVIQHLSSKSLSSWNSVAIEDVILNISAAFPSFSFVYVKMECNPTAEWVAKAAKNGCCPVD
ncbi:hypothetical protein GQ457_18G004200 [Hibiscus cannabinus]